MTAMDDDQPQFLGHPLAWPVGWPRIPAPQRENHWAFKVSFDRARSDVIESVRLLGGTNLVISSNVPRGSRNQPLAGGEDSHAARLDPGVAVYFHRKGRQLVIACDRYTRCRWNLRAIGLAVDGLRAVERSGASQLLDRAFAGFRALPAASATIEGHWTEVLGVKLDTPIEQVEARFKELAREHHPDRGGNHDRMAAITRAIGEAREYHARTR